MWLSVALLAALAPGSVDAAAQASTTESAPVERQTLTLVWEAGLNPIAPEDYLRALRARLPPERFAAVRGDEAAQGWTVVVQQPSAGLYRLEIAPPDARPVARIVDLPDPDVAMRTLALMTVFVLEHGEFPELAEGVREDDPELATTHEKNEREAESEPDTEARPRPQPEAESKPPADAQPREVDATTVPVVRALGGVMVGSPTGETADMVTHGGLIGIDVGAQIQRWAWIGGVFDYGPMPAGEVMAHRFEALAFGGIRPAWQRLHLPVRAGIGGGALFGVGAGESATRAFFVGSLGAGVEGHVLGGFVLGLFAAVEFARRGSTFVTASDAVGLGKVRGGVMVTVGWDGHDRR